MSAPNSPEQGSQGEDINTYSEEPMNMYQMELA